ncbi:hypothetical protein ABIE13_005625 [Ottowia thiooxydans]|uniref:Uncharacterized protein n=1 Tax=Ottowia thiooxydans TaxID=219182 RepID=A0ABV2QHH5_9BURK
MFPHDGCIRFRATPTHLNVESIFHSFIQPWRPHPQTCPSTPSEHDPTGSVQVLELVSARRYSSWYPFNATNAMPNPLSNLSGGTHAPPSHPDFEPISTAAAGPSEPENHGA